MEEVKHFRPGLANSPKNEAANSPPSANPSTAGGSLNLLQF
jgi:hypothetical protein